MQDYACRLDPGRRCDLGVHHPGDRFLRNMVRAIVGTLLEVGRGKLSVEGFRRVIEQKDRCQAGTSVPGNALFLVDVAYPETTFLE